VILTSALRASIFPFVTGGEKRVPELGHFKGGLGKNYIIEFAPPTSEENYGDLGK
jgi:hypothetical protein